MIDISKIKKELRCVSKAQRESLDIQSVSKKLVEKIKQFEMYKSAKTVMIYYPIGSEYDLLPLLEDDKTFVFPVIKDDEIYPVLYNKTKGFKTGKYNIKEPVGDIVDDYQLPDLIILPALCCSKKGCRLGFGKGFYDRFLSKINSGIPTLVVIHSSLLADDVPVEEHDKTVDFVLTEEVIYQCKSF